MTLGSLSRLFVVRLIGQIGPISESDLAERARRAGVDLEFGYDVSLGRYLRSLVGEGLVSHEGERYYITPAGESVLKRVIDKRIDKPVKDAVRVSL